MREITAIGLDIAKNVFQVHGVDADGQVVLRKSLRRGQMRPFFETLSSCRIGMEACSTAHHWARTLIVAGHDVRLIPPSYIKPYLRRQKNDAADAKAIVIAAQRPEMRFIEPKSEGQQARAMLFRSRERLVHQRTELANALRSSLYECGHTFPQGIAHLNRVEALLVDPDCGLPDLVRDECRDLLDQISEKTARIDTKTKRIKALASETDAARPPGT